MWWGDLGCQDKIRSGMKAALRLDGTDVPATPRTWPPTLYYSPNHAVDLSSYLAHIDSPTSHC